MVEAWFLTFQDAGLSYQSRNHLVFNVRTILGQTYPGGRRSRRG